MDNADVDIAATTSINQIKIVKNKKIKKFQNNLIFARKIYYIYCYG
jgi:hypothetical protein